MGSMSWWKARLIVLGWAVTNFLPFSIAEMTMDGPVAGHYPSMNLNRKLEDEGVEGAGAEFDGTYTLTNIAFPITNLKGKLGFVKDARNAFISAMNNAILSFYIVTSKQYEIEEMYATTIVTRYDESKNGDRFDVSIEYEVDMQYNYKGDCDKLTTELDTLLKIAQEPFIDPLERGKFLQKLKQELGKDRSTYDTVSSLDEPPQCVRDCGSGGSVDVTRSPSACPIILTPSFSPNYDGPPVTNQPVFGPQDPGAPLKTRLVERYISVHIYGLRAEVGPEETPPLYQYANIWERETALYTCKYFQGNITVWNLQCQIDLIGVADSNTVPNSRRSLLGLSGNSTNYEKSGADRSLQFSPDLDNDVPNIPDPCRSYMKNNGVYDHGCDIICEPGDAGGNPVYDPDKGPAMYMIYKQIFRFSDRPKAKRRIKADDLATTPFLCGSDRANYSNELKKYVSGRVTGVSAFTLNTPGKNYVFNVDDLVIAFSLSGYITEDIKELEDNQNDPYKAQMVLSFETAMNQRIADFWTRERKWVAIFDLEVQTEVIHSEGRRNFLTDKKYADFYYVEYEVNFRYRSMYRRSFLNPYRVLLDPLKNRTVSYGDEDDGSKEFMKLLFDRRSAPENSEVSFAGTMGELGEFGFQNVDEYGIIRNEARTGPKVTNIVILLIIFAVMLLIFAVFHLRACVERSRPRLDENSCGEFSEREYSDDESNDDTKYLKNSYESKMNDGTDDSPPRLENARASTYQTSPNRHPSGRSGSVYYTENGSTYQTQSVYQPVDQNVYEDQDD